MVNAGRLSTKILKSNKTIFQEKGSMISKQKKKKKTVISTAGKRDNYSTLRVLE
jgi:hypothetical protein